MGARTMRRNLAAFAALLVVGVFATVSAEAGSPFYLTVERSFAPDEKPAVRIDFVRESQPVRVRVLRPDNLETFLDGQLQIRRSYEEPRAAINPAHYLTKGVNLVQSPLDLLRRALSVDLRKSLDDEFGTPLQHPGSGSLVKVPPEIQVRAPKGFKLEREYFIDLQKGGVERFNSLPGFDDGGSYWYGSRYQQRILELDPLPGGVYLVQALQGDNEAQVLVQVSALSMQIKQSSRQILTRVLDRAGAPVGGAKVSFRDQDGAWRDTGKATDANGEAMFDAGATPLGGRLVVRAAAGADRFAIADTDFLPAIVSDYSLYLQTDRPIFKPGDELSFKGTIRLPRGGELKLASDKRDVNVSLLSQKGDEVVTELSGLSLTPFGTFSGSFVLPEDAPPGLYGVSARLGAEGLYRGELRVRDYVKPTFYLEIVSREGQLRPGSQFNVKVKAQRYAGGAPSGARYEYFVYRQKFTVPQFVEEGGGGLSAGMNYGGRVESASNAPQRLFSSLDARSASGDNTWSTAASFAEDGTAELEISLPQMTETKPGEEWVYTLVVRAMDAAGAFASVTEESFATAAEFVAAIAFDRPVAKIGGPAVTAAVKVSYPDGRPVAGAHGFVEVAQKTPVFSAAGTDAASDESGRPNKLGEVEFVTDADGIARPELPKFTAVGVIQARAFVTKVGDRTLESRPVSDETSAVVAGTGGELVALTTGVDLRSIETTIAVGGTAEVLALLPKDWGNGEKGNLWITIAGERVETTQVIPATGRSVWIPLTGKAELGSGFFVTVTAPMPRGRWSESTLAFRQIRPDRVLDVSIEPEIAIVEPLSEQKIRLKVIDANGKPASDVELAVGVVDRAVYAVQPEFRPSIFDFFYPMPRLNLMTFYSDELQGYGYADLIRRPNFDLGALKQRSELPKTTMRDTAAWFPHVVTNAAGEADVTFTMPGNLTEWLVTATAIDKSGRIGEARKRFRSASETTVVPQLAKFMREGDRHIIPFRLATSAPEARDVSVSVATGDRLKIDTASLGTNFKLEPNKEITAFAALEALASDSGAATSAPANAKKFDRASLEVSFTAAGKKPVRYSDIVRIQPAAMTELYSSIPARLGDKVVTTMLPQDAIIRRVSVTLSGGLYGAAMRAGAWLAQYPYGCMEQLTHSTIPNLVLMDLMEKGGVSDEGAGPSAELLRRATANAKAGISKILQHQKSDGGFGAWAGDPESRVGTTLIALRGLGIASQMGIPEAENAVNRASRFLRSQSDREFFAAGARITPESAWQLAQVAEYSTQHDTSLSLFMAAVRDNTGATLDQLAFAIDVHRNAGRRVVKERDRTALERDLVQRTQKAILAFDPVEYNKAAILRVNDSALGFVYSSPTAVSAALGALQRANALPREVEAKGKAILLTQLRGGAWRSTFDTAQVIFNVRGIIQKEIESTKRQGSVRPVAVRTSTGKDVGSLKPVAGGLAESFTGLNLPAADGVELTLSDVPDDAVAVADFEVEVPNSRLVVRDSGMSVARQFYKIGAAGASVIPNLDGLKVGDVIVSRVDVRRSENPDSDLIPSRFVVIEDAVPSIGETIDEDATYLADAALGRSADTWAAQLKDTYRRPEGTTRVVELKPGASFTTYSVWRVAFAGSASVNAARAFDMYDERLRGNSASASASATAQTP